MCTCITNIKQPTEDVETSRTMCYFCTEQVYITKAATLNVSTLFGYTDSDKTAYADLCGPDSWEPWNILPCTSDPQIYSYRPVQLNLRHILVARSNYVH